MRGQGTADMLSFFGPISFALLSHWASLTNHKVKNEIIKTLKMVTARVLNQAPEPSGYVVFYMSTVINEWIYSFYSLVIFNYSNIVGTRARLVTNKV